MTYKPFDLTGKKILVTGGNGGIGLGMARGLVQAGADVAIWGTNADKNAAAIETLLADGNKNGRAWQVNVADEDAVTKAFDELLDHFGRIDSIIANAGKGKASPDFHTMAAEDFNDIIAVNLNGVFFTLRAGARHMVERAEKGDAGGCLIATSSTSAIFGAPRNEHYAASKGAVESLIRGLAVEYARYGVRANAIMPGWIATEMTSAAQGNDKFQTQVIRRVPLRRWGEPEDFAGAAIYLVSDAARFHTGDSLRIDGAYSVF